MGQRCVRAQRHPREGDPDEEKEAAMRQSDVRAPALIHPEIRDQQDLGTGCLFGLEGDI